MTFRFHYNVSMLYRFVHAKLPTRRLSSSGTSTCARTHEQRMVNIRLRPCQADSAEEASHLDPPPAAGAGVAYASTSPSSCARTLPTLAGVSESSAAGGCVGARGGSSSAASAASAHSTYGM